MLYFGLWLDVHFHNHKNIIYIFQIFPVIWEYWLDNKTKHLWPIHESILEICLKNINYVIIYLTLITKQFWFPLTSIAISGHTRDINLNWNSLIVNIHWKMFFCVLQKRERTPLK